MKRYRLKFLSKQTVTKNNNSKLLRADLPQELAHFLILKGMTQNVSATLLMQHILLDWYKKQTLFESEKDLVEEISDLAQFDWQKEIEKAEKRKEVVTKKDFENYRKQVQASLESRGLDSNIAKEIVYNINYNHG